MKTILRIIILVAIFYEMIFLQSIFHELGHILALTAYNIPIEKIDLFGFSPSVSISLESGVILSQSSTLEKFVVVASGMILQGIVLIAFLVTLMKMRPVAKEFENGKQFVSTIFKNEMNYIILAVTAFASTFAFTIFDASQQNSDIYKIYWILKPSNIQQNVSSILITAFAVICYYVAVRMFLKQFKRVPD